MTRVTSTEQKRKAMQGAIDNLTAAGCLTAAGLALLTFWPEHTAWARFDLIAAVFAATRSWWLLRKFIGYFERE